MLPKDKEKKDPSKLLSRTSPAPTVQTMALLRQDQKSSEQRKESQQQEPMLWLLEQIRQEIRESESRVTAKIDQKIDELQIQISKNAKQAKEAAKDRRKIKTKLQKVEAELEELKIEHQEVELTQLRQQMDKANMSIRLRNHPDQRGEQTFEVIKRWLIEETKIAEEILEDGLDTIYRIDSSFARRNNSPREVMIRFTKRRLRDEVLRILEEKERYVAENKLLILREIPFQVRKKRMPYKPLAAFLREKQIKYKWLLPEGIFFNYGGRRQNINSTFKLQQFMEKYGQDFGNTGDKGPNESSAAEMLQIALQEDNSSEEEESSQEQEGESKEEDSQDEAEKLGAAAPKPARIVTRRLRKQEEEKKKGKIN